MRPPEPLYNIPGVAALMIYYSNLKMVGILFYADKHFLKLSQNMITLLKGLYALIRI